MGENAIKSDQTNNLQVQNAELAPSNKPDKSSETKGNGSRAAKVALGGLLLLGALAGFGIVGTALGLKYSGRSISLLQFRVGVGAGLAVGALSTTALASGVLIMGVKALADVGQGKVEEHGEWRQQQHQAQRTQQ